MRNYTMLLICLILNTALQAQNKKSITHEAMTMMKRVSAPEVSPDGKWIIFSVTEPSYNEKEVVNDLWIVAADGKTKPRRLTFGKGSESGFKWSPDGRQIAFSAKREDDEAAQVYLLDFAEGGEAQRFSNISIGAASPQWSRDGNGNPTFSPDGKYLFCMVVAATQNQIYRLPKLVRFNWPSLSNRTLWLLHLIESSPTIL
jgi:Tol biopolymer transport system component